MIVANALINSRLDYCNALFRSLSCRDIKRLQCVQNSIARVVTLSSTFSHISPILRSLHWLPVRQRIVFKTATIVYKVLKSGFPTYLSQHIKPYTCSMNTRRSNPDKSYLYVPTYKSSVTKSKMQFQYSFSYDGPTLWNSLPLSLCSAPSLSNFRRKLKTYLFQEAYPP